MNYKGISFYLSLFCFPISLLSFINILYASYFDFFKYWNLLYNFNYFLIYWFWTFILRKKLKKKCKFFEQLVLIIFSYFLTSLLISIPFYLSNYQVTFLNSIFEAISGLTGTGFSIFQKHQILRSNFNFMAFVFPMDWRFIFFIFFNYSFFKQNI